MIPTALLLGVLAGRWWAVPAVAVGWVVVLLAVGTVGVAETPAAAGLAAANAAVGVGLHRALRALVGRRGASRRPVPPQG